MPLRDGDVAAHRVKCKAFVKHIPEVQQQSPWQRLQAQHAQQFGGAGIGLEELAAAHFDGKLPRHGGVVQGQGGALPTDGAFQLAGATAQGVGRPQALQQGAGIGHVHFEIHLRFALLTAVGRREPTASASECGFGHDDVEFVQLPLGCSLCAGTFAARG